MTPERWREVERLYHAALERDVSERAAFLASTCGSDATLRGEVESLLAHSDSRPGGLDDGALAKAAQLIGEPELTPLVGRRFRVYEIVELIGRGGMGEVYRARDTRLGRDVAIKILPAAFKADPDRVARFEREAQVLASLKHPHIGTIYGIEDAEDATALVMELVDGEDLSARLRRGPLPVSDAMTIARQVAEAVDAAHEQGIVHRDLKPANIRVQRDGTVKVLDFGLAKSFLPDNKDTPTLTAVSQQAGAVIGTPAYMSPEQARGEVTGRESDIWAFGVILYELLTGVSPFARPSTVETLSSVLTAVPDESSLPAAVPPSVRRVIRRCLEKDLKRRWHHMGDVRIELEDALSVRTPDPSPAVALPASPVISAARRSKLRWVAALGAMALALAAYFLLVYRQEERGREVRLQMPPPAGMRFVSVPAISPDGQQVVFAATTESGGDARLWLRPLRATAATELPRTAGASFPFWSADSKSVGFFADGQLKRLNLPDGTPVIVCEAPAGRGGLWLDDDTMVFAPTAFSPLVRVPASGGQPQPLTALASDETGHRFPQRLPGRQLMYFSANRAPEKSGTRLIALDDPARALALISSPGVAEYVKGFLIFVVGRAGTYSVLAQRVTLPEGQLTGEPVEIGRTRVSEVFGRTATATAPTGVVAMLGPLEGLGQFTWISRDGRVLETVGQPASQLGVELSPDGQQLATFRAGDIWTINLARPVPNRVTRGGVHRHPIWSPQGDRLLTLFQGRGIGTFDLVRTSLATADMDTLREATTLVKPMGWMRDGRVVWTESLTTVRPEESIWTMTGDGQPRALFRDAPRILEARVSPDGRWIAYATNRSARFEIEVSGFPEPGQRHPVSVDGGGYPRWRSDGSELYFLAADGRLMAASFAAATPPAIGTPSALFDVKLIAHPDRPNFAAYEYDVNADGSRFLVNRMMTPPDAGMSIIVDWNPPQ